MKKIFILLLSALCLSASAQSAAQRYDGQWSGTLNVGAAKLELIFNLGATPTMDVPAQGAKGIKVDFAHSGDTVELKVPMPGVYFKGLYAADSIAGTFSQNGMQLPLTLSRGAAPKPKRPQTPVPPFPYTTEEVSFSNGSATLSGTLTLPQGADLSVPVVLMITGSGQQNRDEEIFDHKPFVVIADAFARAGIATLRYDDRGFGTSTGNAATATTDTLAADAAAGIAFLRSRGYNRVGALGHSEGGTIAFMLAAEGRPDFVISLAGGIAPGEETLFSQIEAKAPAGGTVTAEQARQAATMLVQQAKLAANPWMKRFLELNPADYIKQVKCPVLALNGEKDAQVLCDRHIPLLQSLLPSAQTKVYPNLNHLFQTCTHAHQSYYDIEETISTEVLRDMVEWVKGQ